MQRYALRQAREKAGLTALDVADKTGIAEMRLYSLERGRGRLRDEEARTLATTLGITTAELKGGAQ